MDYTYSYTTTGADTGTVLAIIGAILIPMLIFGLALYIYSAWALMVIGKKTKTENPWLAWIPIANVYLLTQIAKVPWWTFLAIFLMWIPWIGQIGFMALAIWWWWKISERRNRPGWWSLLLLIPVVNLVILGIMAWGEAPVGTKKVAAEK